MTPDPQNKLILLQALKSSAQGNIDKHKANVDIYLRNAIGIGEHSDIVETIEAWLCALNENNTPTILVLTRQNLALMRNVDSENNLVQLGAYPIIDHNVYEATILATGSEIEIAFNSAKKLAEEKINVRVISFP